MSEIGRRKRDHIDIVMSGAARHSAPAGFDAIHFMHNALPEVDFSAIDLSATFLGRRLRLPFLASSMTGGPDVAERVNRAIAVGFAPANLEDQMFFDGTDSDDTNLNLFDSTLKYMVRPQFPNTALVDPDTQPFADVADNDAAWEVTAITDVGGADADAVVTVTGLKEDVCKRINVTANGVLVSADLPSAIDTGDSEGWREGCFADGTAFTYFRVVATDVAPAT